METYTCADRPNDASVSGVNQQWRIFPMIQLNIGDHTATGANTTGYVAITEAYRNDARRARLMAQRIARTKPGANRYFRSLPLGRTLTALLNDRTIWVNYHATTAADGLTNFAGGKEIAIADHIFRQGRWSILAVLIHELAHVNGVRGAVQPFAAERAVLECELGSANERRTGRDDPRTPYIPGLRG